MRLIILGAGGHGKVVADIANQTKNYSEIYFLDDNPNKDYIIGKCSDFLKYKNDDTEMYPAFGNNEMRLQWMNKLKENGINLAKIIHPLAYVSPYATIDKGSVIMPYATVNTGTKIHKACIINCGAIVDHNCEIDEGCHVAPGSVVKGENNLPKFTKVDSGEVIPLGYYK